MLSRPPSQGSLRSEGTAIAVPPELTRSSFSSPALLSVGAATTGGAGVPRRVGVADLNVVVSFAAKTHLGIVSYSVGLKSGSSPKKDASSGIYTRNWTTESKRFLHERRQREWLQSKAKHGYIDFSTAERAELRRYFDALANEESKIPMDRLETMLISLGLAAIRKEVQDIVSKIDTNGNGALDFEEYLEIFRGRADSEIFQVFKSMMEGRLGDPNLNFQTVISSHRRKLIIDATGARKGRDVRLPSDKLPVQQSEKVLRNFALLQRTRYKEAVDAERIGGPPVGEDQLPFDPTGAVPPGGLGMVWRGVSTELHLAPSRPSSAERGQRSLSIPPSPRAVIDAIVKGGKLKKRINPHGATLVIPAPDFEEQKIPSPKASRRKQLMELALADFD